MTNRLPPLALLREYLAFFDDGVIVLRKKFGRKDRREVGQILGTNTNLGYKKLKLFNTWYLAHRLVFYNFNGWCPAVIDHIDRNPSNNNPYNLRPTTTSSNAANCIKRRGYYRNGKSWQVQIRVKGKRLHVGCFATEREAKRAYRAAVNRHFGSFAPKP
jgi:hypothetical protein